MPRILVTGGAGFVGGILKRHLLQHHYDVTSVDRVPDPSWHPRLTRITGDLRDPWLVNSVFERAGYDAVFHCAAVLSHGISHRENDLWASNVSATRMLAEACRDHGVPKLIFTSTNCLWGGNQGYAVREDDPPVPAEVYGESKLAAEQILRRYTRYLDVVILRCPAIIDRGRAGLLTILFESIRNGEALWVVGDGSNRCQFLFAEDLVRACMVALQPGESDVFHVGAAGVKPLRDLYKAVIVAAGSSSKVRSLPLRPALAAMRLAHRLGVSRMGPYPYRMIAEDFLFDTTRIQERLGWQPTLTNEEMLVLAYRSWQVRREEIGLPRDVFARSTSAPMGLIRWLKWVS
jgi:nucleoside-diphosphate-sugar epimerase